MTEPEPLDEYPASLPETRGGDRLADITVPAYAEGGVVQPSLPFEDDGLSCSCGGLHCEDGD